MQEREREPAGTKTIPRGCSFSLSLSVFRFQLFLRLAPPLPSQRRKAPTLPRSQRQQKNPHFRRQKKNYYSHQNSQVLDDSTDKTTRDLVDDKVAEWRERGVNCYALRRTNRSGYKAGALKEGLEELADYDYIAIFDADFKPEPDFLTATVPYLIDNPEVSFFFRFFASLLPLLCYPPCSLLLLLCLFLFFSQDRENKRKKREREKKRREKKQAARCSLSLRGREEKETLSFFLFFSHPSSFPLFLPLSPTPPPHHPPTTNPRSATSSPAGPLPTRTSPT